MTARDAVLVPPARSDLPVAVASKGPRMMELAARHADAWNAAWFGLPDERLARLRRELAAACERAARDPATLSITVGVTVWYPAEIQGRRRPDIARAIRGIATQSDQRAFVHTPRRGRSTSSPRSNRPRPQTVAAFADAVRRYRAGSWVAISFAFL